MNRQRACVWLLCAAICACCTLPGRAIAQQATASFSLSDLMITPMRIIFEGRATTAEVSLLNRSNKNLSYSLSIVNNRMSLDGSMELIDEEGPGERFASPYLRFTPRRVFLEPGQVQIVRMQLRKPADMEEGEYRSHLSFRVIPETDAVGMTDTGAHNNAISIKLTPIYGLSIPVIARHGELEASVRLSQPEFRHNADPAKGELSVVIEREGNRSVYGNLVAHWKAPGTTTVEIGRINGIAVYTPNAQRAVTMQLTAPEGSVIAGGTLSLQYSEQLEDRQRILAETSMVVR